jgi:hypothetical protein
MPIDPIVRWENEGGAVLHALEESRGGDGTSREQLAAKRTFDGAVDVAAAPAIALRDGAIGLPGRDT